MPSQISTSICVYIEFILKGTISYESSESFYELVTGAAEGFIACSVLINVGSLFSYLKTLCSIKITGKSESKKSICEISENLVFILNIRNDET